MDVVGYKAGPSELDHLARSSSDLGPHPRPNASRSLATEIQDLILQSGLREGDALPPEPELGEQLGVSRTPLREAMRVLTALDIVEIRRGKGTYVGSGSLSPLVSSLVFRGLISQDGGKAALTEILDVRIALDLGSAERLCHVMKGQSDAQLEALVRDMKQLAAQGQSYAQHDRAFHLGLQEKLDSPLMTQLVAAFWDVHTALQPRLGQAEVAREGDMVAQAHQDMLHAACAGDIKAYRRAVQRHYIPIRSTLRPDSDRGASTHDSSERGSLSDDL